MDQKNKILIIDDNLKIQEILSKYLKENNYEVVSAYTGKEGIKKVFSETPGLIVLDLILPKKDGIEVLRTVKGNEKTQNIPIIILTNVEERETLEEAKKLNVAKYLIKSHYNLKEILKEIENSLAECKDENRGGAVPVLGQKKNKSAFMLNDDDFLLSIFENIFKRKGYSFHGLNTVNPQGIMKDIKEANPAVIILDLVMSYNIADIIKQIKSDSNFAKTPLVIVDNVYLRDEIQSVLDAGVDEYISIGENSPGKVADKIIQMVEKETVQDES